MAATITQTSKPLHPRALDTSGNNNHGTAYTGQALEFDGVGDYFSLPSIDLNDDGDFTFAVWLNLDSFNSSDGFTGGHIISGPGGFQATIYSTYLRIDPSISAGGSRDFTHGMSTGNWYRVVYTQSGLSGKLYVNGVLTDSETQDHQVDSGTNYSGYFSKRHSSNSSHYITGKASDLQMWDIEWTASDVTYDYLNPEKLVLDNPLKTIPMHAYSNLLCWYPMNDSTRGQQINLMDGANTGLGSDLVANGDFSDNSVTTTSGGSALSGWTNHATHNASNHSSISNGQLTIVSDGTNTGITQSILTVGELYKLEYTVVANNGGSIATIYAPSAELTSTVGTHTKYFIAENAGLGFKRHGGASCNVTIDNISVKSINAKNHGTSKFYGEQLWANDEALLSTDYGSELVTNGTMEADSNWADRNIGAGESNTRSTEQANNGTYSRKIVATANDSGCKSDNFNVVAGRAYLVECHVYVVSGTCRIQRSGGHVDVTVSSTSTGAWEKLSGIATSSSTTTESFKIVADGGASTFYVDDVSVKEIGSTSELRTGSEIASGALTYNKWYEITARDGIDFTTYGAPDNNIGTKFLLSHADGSSVPTMDSNDKAWLLDFGWSGYAGNTYSITEEEDALRVKILMGSTSTNGLKITFSNSYTEFGTAFAIGREYKFSCKLKVSSGDDVNAIIYDGASSTNLGTYNNTAFGTVKVTFTAKHATNAYFRLGSLSAGDEVWISDFSIVEQGVATGWTEADAQPTIPQLGFQSYNQLAWFTAADDLVDINADTSLASGSYSFWAISNRTSGKNLIFGHGHEYSGVFAFNWSSNRPILRIGANKYVMWDDTSAQDDGNWHHWVVYMDADDVTDSKLYVDGVLQAVNATANTGLSQAYGEGLNIGAEKASSPSHQFEGCITEFSWWNKELSLAEAQELYNDGEALDALTHSSVANLSGYWRNRGNTTWTDLSTNSNNGTPTSVSEYLTLPEGNNGRDTQGFLMNANRVGLNNPQGDSSPQHILCPHIDSLDETATFSISFWMKPRDFSSLQYIISNHKGTNESIRIYILGGLVYFVMSNTSSNIGWVRYDDGTDLGLAYDTWTHITWTFNGARTFNSGTTGDAADMTKVYANGVWVEEWTSVSSQSYATTTGDMTTCNFAIGALAALGGTPNDSYKGQIDDVAVYNTELTANQVERNYKAGKRRHKN